MIFYRCFSILLQLDASVFVAVSFVFNCLHALNPLSYWLFEATASDSRTELGQKERSRGPSFFSFIRIEPTHQKN